jgi:rhodanese-related sulfurtransferase
VANSSHYGLQFGISNLPRPAELTPEEVNRLAQQGYLILDVRAAASFGNGHVPGAINIGPGGQFASWAGTIIPAGTPIIIVADDAARVDEAAKSAACEIDSCFLLLQGYSTHLLGTGIALNA